MTADGHLLDTIGPGRLPITIRSGQGARLVDTEGREYWDFYGGHAVALIGHGHPRWVEAVTRQARELAFYTAIADVPVRARAARALSAFTGYPVVWFVNSGAEANEAALKIARKATGRPVIVAMVDGFHGRSMGALGVTWHYRDQHQPPHGETRFVPFGDIDALRSALDGEVAAVITEPIQAMAGVVIPPAGWLPEAAKAARANGSLLVVDEGQAGMGRTGWPLACDREGVRPDMVTVSKGLGGGFPVAALLLGRELAAGVQPGEHGTTFGGGPMACAAVEATIDIFLTEGLLERARRFGELLSERFAAVPGVTAVRAAGAWAGFVLDRPASPVARALLERGYIVGTATHDHVLRIAPPSIMPFAAIDGLAAALREILAAPAAERPAGGGTPGATPAGVA